MPKLRTVISIINTSLQNGVFAARPFQSGQYSNLAEIVSKEEANGETITVVKQPAVFDLSGEGTDVSPDDTFPIQFYHRLASALKYPDDPDNSFGNPGHDTTEVADMMLICIVDTSKVGFFAEDICAGIMASMRAQLSDGQLVANGFDSCVIDIADSSIDSERIFNQEFQGVPFTLKPSMKMVSVRYTITTVYSKKCFTLCN